ncbi:MAG: excinuclease ABC subunit UvrC [Clostridiales bacterium]|jgi:excinuclease ABC subunit C|nr:excinuclease ABC subunit UvrC [Clostridiales bacterium]
MFDIQEELKRLPRSPGVYLFIGSAEEIIYVGKALNLRSRVRSYYTRANLVDPKVRNIRGTTRRFEYIVTDTEVEALILECNLIKEHQPKYNVLLKDDKSYPYIKVTLTEDFPRVFSTRDFVEDGGKYFGPYTSSFAVRETLEQIHKIWPLRRTSKKITAGIPSGRPCLNYHIGLCPGPCGLHIGREEYGKRVAQVMEFLSGKQEVVIKQLEAEMGAAAEAMEYERAADIRDKIASIRRMNENQKADRISKGDQDVIAFAAHGDEALFQVFFIRDGKMTGREHFMVYGVEGVAETRVMTEFITQFYSGTPFVPKELILQHGIEGEDTIKSWLATERGKKVMITVPKLGEKQKLVQLARNNAIITLEQFGEHIKKEEKRTTGALDEIKEALGLESPIFRIEAYDISNIQGYENVGSMVVFEGGKPRRSDYRKFKIRSISGPNDYAAMQEVISRRFRRYEKERAQGMTAEAAKFSRLPDIIFIDGGKGHISAVSDVLAHMGLNIPLCGMVKDERHRTRGLLYNGDEAALKPAGEGFRLVARIQEEVHRFAVEYHRKLRQKSSTKSVLDDIKGIGDVRRRALLLHFGSVERVKTADMDALAAAPSMNLKSAKAVYDFFQEVKNERS